MSSFRFQKHAKYSRKEIWETVQGKEKKMTRNFQQSGYERIDEDLFAFINIGYRGNAGHIFPNKYDRASEKLMWYGKKQTHSKQPLMKSIIDGATKVYCFARWEETPKFEYLGIGRVIGFNDNFTDVYDKDGTQTFCIEFELNCKDNSESPALLSSFDDVFEQKPYDTKEGKEKYVRHKTRERRPEIIREKKKEFLKTHGRLFCEACGFDFEKAYGKRGDGFIECHHNVPLHQTDGERVTKISDLSLLCSNCHRMVHRKKKWLTIAELKGMLVK